MPRLLKVSPFTMRPASLVGSGVVLWATFLESLTDPSFLTDARFSDPSPSHVPTAPVAAKATSARR